MTLTAPADVVRDVRRSLGDRLFARVAGPEGARRRERVHGTEGPRWFPEDAAIRRVHGDASMFVGGIRAVTTFGAADDAEQMVAAVRSVHERVVGTAPDGRPYAASDPHLLRWVHVAEIDSFLAAHQRYGAQPLDPTGRDAYVADAARVAESLGVTDPPRSEAELRAQLKAYRPELQGTPAARQAARFLLLHPPLGVAARVPYAGLAAAAVGLMPVWARRQLRLPYLPVTERTVVRATGTALTRTIRWAMAPR